jgi:hypothetical protein
MNICIVCWITYYLFNLNFTQSLFIKLPSVTGIFWAAYWIFNNYAWKFKIFRKNYYFAKSLIQTPILEGNLKGNYYFKRRCPYTNKIIENKGEGEGEV